jgi:hypothetical protein
VTPASFSALAAVAAFLGDGDQQALGGDEGVAAALAPASASANTRAVSGFM